MLGSAAVKHDLTQWASQHVTGAKAHTLYRGPAAASH